MTELQREVEALAEQKRAVGLCKHFGEGAEARIGNSSRAFHADDGNAYRVFQCGRERSASPRQSRGSDEDQRARRVTEPSQ